MLRLTLVRHAKSNLESGVDDFERPLSKKGLRDGPAMAEMLAERGDAPGVILSSPAMRAKTTSGFFADAFGYPPRSLVLVPEIYEATASTLLQVIQEKGDPHGHVFLVGHNPGLDRLAEILTGRPFCGFVTTSVVDFQADLATWSQLEPGKAVFRSCLFPKMFPAP